MKASYFITVIAVGLVLCFGFNQFGLMAEDGDKAETEEKQLKPTEIYKDGADAIEENGVEDFWQAVTLLSRLKPGNADILEKAIASDDATLRTAAVSAMFKIMKKEKDKSYVKKCETALWKTINSEDADLLELREIAINVLGKYGTEENGAKLLKFAENAPEPELVMVAVYRAYTLTDEVDKKELLIERLQSDRLDLRAKAAFMLADMGEVDKVKKILEEVKGEPSLRGLLAEKLEENEKLYSEIQRAITGGEDRNRIRHLEGALAKAEAYARDAADKYREMEKQKNKLQKQLTKALAGGGGSTPSPGPQGPGPQDPGPQGPGPEGPGPS